MFTHRAHVRVESLHRVLRQRWSEAAKRTSAFRYHHLLKTFWTAWRDQQYPDGTVVWTSPSGQEYVTRPGSQLLFPGLCVPISELPTVPTAYRPSGDRGRGSSGLPLRWCGSPAEAPRRLTQPRLQLIVRGARAKIRRQHRFWV